MFAGRDRQIRFREQRLRRHLVRATEHLVNHQQAVRLLKVGEYTVPYFSCPGRELGCRLRYRDYRFGNYGNYPEGPDQIEIAPRPKEKRLSPDTVVGLGGHIAALLADEHRVGAVQRDVAILEVVPSQFRIGRKGPVVKKMDIAGLVALRIHSLGRDVAHIPDGSKILQIVQSIVRIHQSRLRICLRLIEILGRVESVGSLAERAGSQKGSACKYRYYTLFHFWKLISSPTENLRNLGYPPQ